MEPYSHLSWVVCEYCNQDSEILYGWHGDIWCASCITDIVDAPYLNLKMTGTLEEAPMGWFKGVSYEQPYVFQTPDRRVVGGIVSKSNN